MKDFTNKASERIIIGIDPGTNIMGYGIISVNGNALKLIDMGVMDMKKLANQALKLKEIFERTCLLIDTYNPDCMALEDPFYGKNVQSMLKLGRAQGVAMAAALAREVPINEYSPKKVKQSVCGNGNASKEQVAAMLKNLLQFKDTPRYLDATDGLAVAVCHHFQTSGNNTGATGKNYTGWNAFLSANPERKA